MSHKHLLVKSGAREKILHRASVQRAHVVAAIATAMLAVLGSTNWAQTGCVPEDFTTAAISRDESGIVLASSVNIHIDRWSTEAQKDRFARTLLDRGPDALLEALRDADRVGQLDILNDFPYDFQFAWQEPHKDGDRRIVLIGDRPMFVWKDEMAVEEDGAIFTVVEIRLGPDGTGEGKVAVGSHAVVNRSFDLIELKNYDTEPVRLIDVRTNRHTT